MSKKNKTAYCVIRNEKLLCTKCGREQVVPFPIDIDMFSAMITQFQKSHKDCKQTYTPPIVNMELTREERERWWLQHGERGQSSKSIFAKLSVTGLKEATCNYPYDPDDFSRCYALLKIVPEFRAELHKMKEEGGVWSDYVDNWDNMTEMYENKDTGMYGFMQTILEKNKYDKQKDQTC